MWKSGGLCPVFANFTLAFALQVKKKHVKPSVRLRKPSVRVRKTSVQYLGLSPPGCFIQFCDETELIQ
jgi:hypothetical protein